jgi:hypothetical protein
MTGTVGKWHLHAEGGPDKGYIPITTQYPAFTAKAQGTGMDFADGFYAGPLPLTLFPLISSALARAFPRTRAHTSHTRARAEATLHHIWLCRQL